MAVFKLFLEEIYYYVTGDNGHDRQHFKITIKVIPKYSIKKRNSIKI
jgi:hypothetical protein